MCEATVQVEDGEGHELGANAPHARRNHVLGVLAGMFAGMARDFVHPTLILAGFVYALTRSPFLVALIPIFSKAGVLAPQLVVSGFVEHAPRRRPYFIIITVVRSLAFAGLVGAMWLVSRRTDALSLTVFFVTYLLACMSGGIGHIIFMDMVGRLIPRGRVGSFLGMRTFLGGAASIGIGLLVIQPILSGLELPGNYILLAAIGTVLAATDMSIWSMCREEPGPSADERTNLREALGRGVEWLKDRHNYRCYMWMRVAFRVSYLGLAFFIPYGTEKLQQGAEVVVLGGIMVATMKLSRVVTGAVWGKVADVWGSRTALVGAGGFMFAAPALALLAPRVPGVFEVPLPGVTHGLDLPLCIYLLALACIGTGMRASGLGGQRFLITSAPERRRPSYIAFLNTLTSPLTLLPLAGAWLAQEAGMNTLFVVVMAGGLLFLANALRMKPPAGDSAVDAS